METIDKITNYIAKATELIDEEDNKNYFTKNLEAIENAKKIIDDSVTSEQTDERKALLLDAVTKWANQLTFLLFRHNTLTDELVAEFRTFKSPEETTAEVKSYEATRADIVAKINDEQKAVMDEQRALDIYKGVIGGMSPEEATQKMAEYEESVRQAQAQLRR